MRRHRGRPGPFYHVHTFRAHLMGNLQLTSTNHLVRYVVKHEADMTRPPATEPGPPRLSKRECEVLAWFVEGRSCKDIGARMGIAYMTVQTYRARIMDKLKLTNTTDLIRYAVEHQADRLLPVPAQPTPLPVVVPAVVRRCRNRCRSPTNHTALSARNGRGEYS